MALQTSTSVYHCATRLEYLRLAPAVAVALQPLRKVTPRHIVPDTVRVENLKKFLLLWQSVQLTLSLPCHVIHHAEAMRVGTVMLQGTLRTTALWLATFGALPRGIKAILRRGC